MLSLQILQKRVIVFTVIKYLIKRALWQKDRQGLLLLACTGIFLSAFSLITVQGIMGGLQNGLTTRSKVVQGQATYFLRDPKISKDVLEIALKNNVKALPEYQLDLLIQSGPYLSPAIVHGIDNSKSDFKFLVNYDLSNLVLGGDLFSKLGSDLSLKTSLVSPSHTDEFFGDIPRSVDVELEGLVFTDVPEVDLFHAWVDREVLATLTRERIWNVVKIFGDDQNIEKFQKEVQEKFQDKGYFRSWEEMNSSLFYALRLESRVMFFLFASMCLLVAFTISSGLTVFFDRVKKDLVAFWIVGESQKTIRKHMEKFSFLVTAGTSFIGVLAGIGFLLLLKTFGQDIMPQVFVERSIPIDLSPEKIISSFAIPATISLGFAIFVLKQVFGEKDLALKTIRSYS